MARCRARRPAGDLRHEARSHLSTARDRPVAPATGQRPWLTHSRRLERSCKLWTGWAISDTRDSFLSSEIDTEPVACGPADHGWVATADGRQLGTTRYRKS